MPKKLTVILDDRDDPAESVRAALGEVACSDILRRRRTMAEELAELARMAGADRVVHLRTEADGTRLARDIREHSVGKIFLRLPLVLPPLQLDGLAALIRKAAYALDTMLASPVRGDEAVAILTPADAQRLIEAASPRDRQSALLELRAEAPLVTDHAEFIDIRQSRNLLLYLSGATELRLFNVGGAEGGVFRKRSADGAKMRAEHGFYHAAPPEMQRFLLPTFDFWEKPDEAGYAMEYLAVPDAALQWIHRAFSQNDFGLLLDRFFEYCAARPEGDRDRKATRSAGEDHILGKLAARLDSFLQSDVGRKVNALLGNAGPHGDLRVMQKRAEPLIRAALAQNRAPALVLSHGDPCFSNILFDRRIGLMRLIDPRGGERAEEAMMHPLYDLAKLSHSVLGGYDFVNQGLFRVGVDADLTLQLDLIRTPPDWAEPLLRQRMAAAGYDSGAVRAVELSLFLSMLPLHADHPDKLLGFALIAGDILDELEGGENR